MTVSAPVKPAFLTEYKTWRLALPSGVTVPPLTDLQASALIDVWMTAKTLDEKELRAVELANAHWKMDPAPAPTGARVADETKPAPKDPAGATASPMDAQDLARHNAVRETQARLDARVLDLEGLKGAKGEALVSSARKELHAKIDDANRTRWRKVEASKDLHALQGEVIGLEIAIGLLNGAEVAALLEDARKEATTHREANKLLLFGSKAKKEKEPPKNGTAPAPAAEKPPPKQDPQPKKGEVSLEDALKEPAAGVVRCATVEGGVKCAHFAGHHDELTDACLVKDCHCARYTTPQKGKSKATEKLEALVEHTPIYTGPPLSKELLADLTNARFRYVGNATAEANETKIHDALVTMRDAELRDQRRGVKAAVELLRAFGWARSEAVS